MKHFCPTNYLCKLSMLYVFYRDSINWSYKNWFPNNRGIILASFSSLEMFVLKKISSFYTEIHDKGMTIKMEENSIYIKTGENLKVFWKKEKKC